MRREPDALVRSDSGVWAGALSEEKAHYSSRKRLGVTSRFLNLSEEWEFAVCVCCPSSSVICLRCRVLHGAPLGALGDIGFDCVRDLLASILE